MKPKLEYELEKKDERLTWIIRVDGKKIGTMSLQLTESDDLDVPALSFVLDEASYENGIAKQALKEPMRYAYGNLPYEFLYARYLKSNKTDEKLLSSLDFESDGKPYEDDEGQLWQNVKLTV